MIRNSRFWGPIWWGIPTAIAFAVLYYGRQHGFDLRSYWSVDVLVVLVVALASLGLFGGLQFGRVMDKTIRKPDHRR